MPDTVPQKRSQSSSPEASARKKPHLESPLATQPTQTPQHVYVVTYTEYGYYGPPETGVYGVYLDAEDANNCVLNHVPDEEVDQVGWIDGMASWISRGGNEIEATMHELMGKGSEKREKQDSSTDAETDGDGDDSSDGDGKAE